MLHQPSATGLYWSMRGEVACSEHSPKPDDPRWTVEGWCPLPASSGHMRASRYQCQHCAIDGRAFIHLPNNQQH